MLAEKPHISHIQLGRSAAQLDKLTGTNKVGGGITFIG